jgi:Rps23 Pro-64 3,4-dihydroxylase Tpa1-like proline 4-hydroxylase
MTASSATTAFAAIPPHLVLRDAFDPALVDQLLAYVAMREDDFFDTGIGKNGAVDKTVRRSRKIREFGPLRDALEDAFRAAMPQAISALGLARFELASLSLELAAHGDGDFYRRHIDTFVGEQRQNNDRVLTGVFYFHNQPKAFEGGELRLYSLLPIDKGGRYLDIEPAHNSLLLFPAWAPHEVRAISCPNGGFAQSRFAINCWYNRRAT